MKKAIPTLLHPMGRVKNLLFHTQKEAEFHTAENLKTNKSLSSYIANFTKKKKELIYILEFQINQVSNNIVARRPRPKHLLLHDQQQVGLLKLSHEAVCVTDPMSKLK